MKLKRKRLDGPSMGGLLATRQGAITLALLCGLGATAILIFAIGKYRHAEAGGTKQDTVLVATSEIQKGTPAATIASKQLYKVTPVLVAQVSPDAIADAASLTGTIAASNILPGQQLTSSDFTTVAVSGDISGELAPGERAISVALDPSHGIGVLQTGDRVDVYASVTSPVGPVVTLLVPDAIVLQAPAGSSSSSSSTSSSSTSTSSQGSTVLLGVTMQLAPRVMWVFDNGKVWLALRGIGASNPAPTITGLRQVLLGDHLSATPTYSTP